MLKIYIEGRPIDLPKDFSVAIDDTSPIYNDMGCQSMPATVPATPANVRAFGWPHRLDYRPETDMMRGVLADGAFIRSGSVNLTDAGREAGYSFNFGFDNSEAYAAWQNRKLRDLSGLPVIPGFGPGNMQEVYTGQDDRTPWLAVFPIAVGRGEADGKTVWELLNIPRRDGSFIQPTRVKRVIGNEVKEVNVPANYGLSPFVKVWKLLELIFADLSLRVMANPFAQGDLSDLVVLNNCADALCTGELKVVDLLPDCTVTDFLDALKARFGLMYAINFNSRTVRLMLLRDIIAQEPAGALDDALAAWPVVTYAARKYVKLSAKTSLEGAAPVEERWEDFAKADPEGVIRLGGDPKAWVFRDPELPDYDDPIYSAVMGRQYVTGKFYRLDPTNSKVMAAGSPFFCWDPQPEGCEEYALESPDECVPVERVSAIYAGWDWDFADYCPAYLAGSVHRHSYIAGETAEEQESTPLAIMLAYTSGHKTVGRLWPERDNGSGIILDDGRRPQLSLLWQFRGGLFEKFWQDYDRLLRRGERTVTFPAIINKIRLRGLDMLRPYRLEGTPCLIDTLSYTLPAPADMPVEVTLRVIKPRNPDQEVSYQIRDIASY